MSNYEQDVPILRDASGHEVPLRELTPEAELVRQNCTRPELFEPIAPLLANQTYTIGVEDEPSDEPDAERDATAAFTFTTGEESPASPASPAVELHLYRIVRDPTCTGPECRPQANVEVRLTHAPPDEESPSWLLLEGVEADFSQSEEEGSGAQYTELWGGLWDGLLGKRDTLIRSVLLPGDDGCVRYRKLDGRGKIVAEGTRCIAEKCARLLPEAAASWICGGLPELSSHGWSRVSEASCSAPPALTVGWSPGEYEIAPGDAPGAMSVDGGRASAPVNEPVPDEPSPNELDGEERAAHHSGCRAGPGGTHTAHAWLPLSVLALMGARSRRRHRA